MVGERREDHPFSPLTEKANEVLELVNDKGLLPDDHKIIVFVSSPDASGIGAAGYGEDDPDADLSEVTTEVVVDLFMHLKAMMKANGKDLQIIPVSQIGQG